MSSSSECLLFRYMVDVSCAHRIGKGDSVLISIVLVNRLKQFWGPDAREFRFVLSDFQVALS